MTNNLPKTVTGAIQSGYEFDGSESEFTFGKHPTEKGHLVFTKGDLSIEFPFSAALKIKSK